MFLNCFYNSYKKCYNLKPYYSKNNSTELNLNRRLYYLKNFAGGTRGSDSNTVLV